MAKQEKTAAELYREERKARIAKAAKKNAKKSHKVILTKGMKKAIAAVVVLAIISGIGAFVMNNAGVFERGKTAFYVGDVEVKSAEYGYYYMQAFSNQFNMSYQYSMYGYNLGYDYSVSPDKQAYTGEIEGVENPMYTDYFDYQTKQSIGYVKACVKYAEENDIKLDKFDMASIDATVKEYEDEAKSMNYSFGAFLRNFYHKGLTPELFRNIIMEQTIATKVSEVKTDEIAASYSDKKLEKTFNGALTTYGVASLRVYEFLAEKETVKATEEGKSDTEEVTDATMADAKAKAEAFAAKITNVDTFKAEAAEIEKATGNKDYKDFIKDDSKTARTEILYSDLSYEVSDEKFLKWAYDKETKAGTTYIVENKDSGYAVYMMETPVGKAVDKPNYDVRHILVKFPETAVEKTPGSEVEIIDASAYDVTVDLDVNTKEITNKELFIKAQDILKDYLAGEKTETDFAILALKNSEDGNAMEGGIYEDVVMGKMVPEFEGWALKEGRKYGDVGIVETEYGYHIMYYVGEGTTLWSDTVRNNLATEDYEKFAEELQSNENVVITGINDKVMESVEEFVVSFAKRQISNIKAQASAGYSY